ncbi:putative calcium uniporter protein, mitochondrial [Trypanosoma grayi]|uniref:putative calcium uniporter protein, mitochondrial n=1 Tax=Trypanosoma grayi TaxID=71804 RepID=UPI0004F49959|nr:putative calcium uniporter protein, mitochondrial [Trypanosoma grayi]KEG09835.1 putative calcium uniporter protein, mitochondrial [Trypanosoma grayi]
MFTAQSSCHRICTLLARGPMRWAHAESSLSPLLSAMRCCTTTATSASTGEAPPPPPLTASEFASIAPMVLLRQALQQHAAVGSDGSGGRDVISRAVFDHYCRESHVADSDVALQLLEESGVLVSISHGVAVHLRPARLLQMYETLQGGTVDFFVEEARRRVSAAEVDEEAMRSALEPALRRAAKWRRFVWGGALCFAGLQLAVISRLTFFDLDWDIMEPVSYFIGTGTSLVFFLYFLRHGRSHTYEDYDRTVLPARVRRYAPPDFDWEKYEVVCRRVDEERRMLEKIRAWVKQH